MVLSDFQCIKFSEGEALFKEGDQGDCAYIVLSGEFEVHKQNNGEIITLATLGFNQVIGEMALISPGARTATVVAKEDSEVLLLEQSQFIERKAELNLVVKVIFDVVLERFRQTLSSITPDYNAVQSSNLVTHEMEQALAQLHFENEIKRGIIEDEFELYYQPIIDLASGAIAGAECLMRWNHPTRGLVPPNEFIPVAEASNLILDMTKIAVDKALSNYQDFSMMQASNSQNVKPMFIALNVSGRDLETDALCDVISSKLKTYKIPRQVLKVEVTETSLMNDIDACCQRLEFLKELGVLIAIDDFGTGYSSMDYLTKIPLSTLKIDGSFVFKMSKEPQSRKIVNAILTLAKELELDVVAEGIETYVDAEYLKSQACEYGQGYVYSKPLCKEDFISLLQSWDASIT